MQIPEVRYARAGDLRLAYQKWGEGPPLMMIPDLISNVEITWEHELYRRTLEHLGKYMTCVYFDKRGIGMSDRFDAAPTLAQRNDAPSHGVSCGIDLCDALRGMGIEIRAGLHAGEIEHHEDGDISGIAVNLAARVEQCAADGELWASSTVRDMLLGGSGTFTERGEHQLKGIDGAWRLFSVAR